MRCPKCHYLSFDPEPRCRNCGYGLSLEDDDLLIRSHDDDTPPLASVDDVNLRAAPIELPPPPKPRLPEAAPAPAHLRGTPAFRAVASAIPPVADDKSVPVERGAPDTRTVPDLPLPQPPFRPPPTTELPLFVRGTSGAATASARVLDEPLVQLSEEPRPPLVVRRTIPDSPAAKPRQTTVREPRGKGPLDPDLLTGLHEDEPGRPNHNRQVEAAGPVGAGRRLLAASIDGALLGSLSVAVMWLTLRWCGLPVDRALMLPVLLPTSVFVSMLGVGYLVLFNAAGGQTLGKMAAGLRVVREVTPFDAGGPVSLGQAIMRALFTLPSVLAAGAGFLPALVGEQRAVHDRLAHTRVVRA